MLEFYPISTSSSLQVLIEQCNTIMFSLFLEAWTNLDGMGAANFPEHPGSYGFLPELLCSWRQGHWTSAQGLPCVFLQRMGPLRGSDSGQSRKRLCSAVHHRGEGKGCSHVWKCIPSSPAAATLWLLSLQFTLRPLNAVTNSKLSYLTPLWYLTLFTPMIIASFLKLFPLESKRAFLGIIVLSLFLRSSSVTACNAKVEQNITFSPLFLAILTAAPPTSSLVRISVLNFFQINKLNSLWDIATWLQTWHIWSSVASHPAKVDPSSLLPFNYWHSYLIKLKHKRIIFDFSLCHVLHIHSPRFNKAFVKMNLASSLCFASP